MARMSNRDRIARAAEEARLTAEDKVAKKAKKKATKRPAKPPAKGGRMKVVWVVCNSNGKALKTYAYPDKAEAEAETRRLSSSTGNSHHLRATKVPMD